MKKILFYNILGAIQSNNISEIFILFEYFRNMCPCTCQKSAIETLEKGVKYVQI